MKKYKIKVTDKYGDKITYGDVVSHNLYCSVKGGVITNTYSVKLSKGVILHGSFVSIEFC